MNFAKIAFSTIIGTLLLAMSLLGNAQDDGDLSLYGAVQSVVEWYSEVWDFIFQQLSFLNRIPFIFIDSKEQLIIEFTIVIFIPFVFSRTRNDEIIAIKAVFSVGFAFGIFLMLLLPVGRLMPGFLVNPYVIMGQYFLGILFWLAMAGPNGRNRTASFVAVQNIVFAIVLIAMLSTTNWVDWGREAKPISASRVLAPGAPLCARLQR